MQSTQKILIAGLILMVVLNIGTLGFILCKSQEKSHHRMGMEGGGERHRHGKFLGKKLDFTEAQEESLGKLKKEHEEKLSVLKERSHVLRKQQFELIKAETYDQKKGDEIADEIGTIHREMDKEMAAHFLAIKALCTKEQLPKFNAFIDKISDRKSGFGHGIRHGKEGRDRDRKNREERKGNDQENQENKTGL